MFMASNTVPWFELPSPPNATLTRPSPRFRQAIAAPTALGGPPPPAPVPPRAPRIPAANPRPRGDGRSAADDRVRAEHPTRRIGDVHRAALAVAEPVPAPVDLEHHAGHVAALGDAVTVSAMRAHDVV